MKLLPSDDELLLVAAEGLPKEMIGEARVPADLRSQSGYALAAGKSIVVEDLTVETGFQQSELQRSQGMQSAAIILIKGHGRPYGVIGAGSRLPDRFSQEDVSFMQAIANVLANAIDRRPAEQRTQHEALHDPLTGLAEPEPLPRPPRARPLGRRAPRSPVSVLFLDLDQFKLVNDSLGHAAGDELLAAVAPRIEAALRPGDTVARFGGDDSPSSPRTSAASTAPRGSPSASPRRSPGPSSCVAASTSSAPASESRSAPAARNPRV